MRIVIVQKASGGYAYLFWFMLPFQGNSPIPSDPPNYKLHNV